MRSLASVLVLCASMMACDYGTDSAVDPVADAMHGKVVKAGLFKVIRSGGLVNSDRTSTGKAISKPVIQLVKATHMIPLIKDAHMSFQYRIWNVPEDISFMEFRRVLKHPAMTLPDGSVRHGSEYPIKGKVSVGQVIAYTGYGLNEDYEMLEGDWTFEIWYHDTKLVEQTFTTYTPNAIEAMTIGNLSPVSDNLSQPEAEAVSATDNSGSNDVDGIQSAAKKRWQRETRKILADDGWINPE